MKPEQERVIEAMVGAWFDEPCDDQFSLRMKRALRAAAKEGFVLAKLPTNRRPKFDGYVPAQDGEAADYWTDGFEEGIESIETITFDKE